MRKLRGKKIWNTLVISKTGKFQYQALETKKFQGKPGNPRKTENPSVIAICRNYDLSRNLIFLSNPSFPRTLENRESQGFREILDLFLRDSAKAANSSFPKSWFPGKSQFHFCKIPVHRNGIPFPDNF